MGVVSLKVESNPALANLLLNELIRRIETEKGMDELLRLGCDAEFIDGLRRRTARDLLDVSSQLRSIVVSFSTSDIAQHLFRLDRQRKDDSLCEYFVKNGAGRQLIASLFKRSTDEVKRLRQALLPDGYRAAGRTSLPRDFKTRDSIHAVWDRLQREQPDESLRIYLFLLHKEFSEFTIDTLHSTINEFAQESASVSDRSARVISISSLNKANNSIRLTA